MKTEPEEKQALVKIEQARQALVEAATIQEVHHLIGMARAVAIYTKQVKGSEKVIEKATEIRIRGERRLGEMLASQEKSKGALKRGPVVKKMNHGNPTLKDLGVTKAESSRAQKLASMPEEEFEEVIATAKDDGKLSTHRVLKTREKQERKKKREFDFFPTPSWCVRRLLEACQLPVGMWLEPAVGDGSIVRAVNGIRPGVQWTTVDIRPECKPDRVGDFLELPVGGVAFDVVITNPPYNLAFEFVQSAMRRAKNVVMLLRLNWLASETRAGWLRENMPTDIYVLPNRPDFDGGGGDMTEYAWMLWTPEIDPEFRSSRYGRISVLKTTTLEERNKG